VRVTTKGQVTIPKRLRDELGLGAGCEVEVDRDGNTIVIRRADGSSRGRQIAERLRRRGNIAFSTDEIMDFTRGD
jgi:antitoxin PrlF